MKYGTVAALTTRSLACLLLALVSIAWTQGSLAATTFCTSAGGTLNLPPITVPRDAPVGSPLNTPVSITVTFNCSGLPFVDSTAGRTATIQAGNLAPADATDQPNGSSGIMFQTNVPGIALQLTASPIQASDKAWVRGGPDSTRGFEPGAVTAPANAWVCQGHGQNRTCSGNYNGAVSETFTAQLVKTGTVTAGPLNAITLMQFNWYIYGVGPSQGYFASLRLASTAINVSACSVDPGSQNFTVSLPSVASNAFTGIVGTTAMKTPFQINLTCSAGTTVNITMDASNPDTLHPGVVLPAGTGYAQGVGVQVLDGSNHAVAFGVKKQVGAAPNGPLAIPYSAQYFETSALVTGGLVKATVTFTMSYE
ncbi:MAG TPA: fimbrial protein [Rhodanobacter sp.]|nr:fimbrial protein [Rhodanobacter sp.]